jgi:3-hydroxybutyryl-CoA dehydrogenase
MRVNEIAVIGAGTMGAGIAQLAAKCGCVVHLIDVNGDVLAGGIEAIAKRFARSVEKGRMSETDRDATMRRIKPADAIGDLGGVELAIEAVVENMDVKHKVFAQLENATPKSAILASNTSSLSVSKIAESVSDPSRVVGMHFFNPAPVMPLVEVIAGAESSAASIDFAFQAAKSWGKVPVRAKDTPGFIVNRVARGFYLEALRLLGEGVAGIDEIDQVMKTHGGFRMGPFELMDLVGLDVNLAVSTSVWQQMNKHPRFTPHEIQQSLVEAGHLGRKTGRGFYSYEKEHPLAAFPVSRQSFEVNPKLGDVLNAFCTRSGVASAGSTEQYVFARILCAILNEAGLAWGARVATSDDIDIAMQKGTNYPKGPLAWADEIGGRNVRGALRGLNDVVGDGRYEPAKLFADAD